MLLLLLVPEIAEERRKGISRGKILVVNSCTIERVVMVQLRSDTTVAVVFCCPLPPLFSGNFLWFVTSKLLNRLSIIKVISNFQFFFLFAHCRAVSCRLSIENRAVVNAVQYNVAN